MTQTEVTYKSYLEQPEALTFDEMQTIHEAILKNDTITDTDFQDAWQSILQAALRYTTIRAQWHSFSQDEKRAIDAERTTLHNTIIDQFIFLERVFQLNQWDSQTWTSLLFLQEHREKRTRQDVNQHRTRIGDFANYLVFAAAVNGR